VRRNNAAAIAVGSVSQPKLSGLGGASGRLRPLSARETSLAACLGLLALGAAAVYAQGWSAAQRDRFVNAEADLTLARGNHAIALQKGSADTPDTAQLAAIDGWSTHARSFWLARLEIEQQLEAAAATAHLPAPEIRLAQALEDADTPLLKAEVSGPYVAGPWLAFMRALAADGPSFVVDKLDVSDANSAQFALVLLFPVTLDTPPPAEPAS
jgi:hypothetical protein